MHIVAAINSDSFTDDGDDDDNLLSSSTFLAYPIFFDLSMFDFLWILFQISRRIYQITVSSGLNSTHIIIILEKLNKVEENEGTDLEQNTREPGSDSSLLFAFFFFFYSSP